LFISHCFSFKISYIHRQIHCTMKLTFLTLFFLSLNLMSVSGQVDPCHKSTEGKDFWFGFMEGRNYQSGHFNEITVTSIYTCNYNIFIGKSLTPYTSGTVLPDVPVRLRLTGPWLRHEVPKSSRRKQFIWCRIIHLMYMLLTGVRILRRLH